MFVTAVYVNKINTLCRYQLFVDNVKAIHNTFFPMFYQVMSQIIHLYRYYINLEHFNL